MHSDEDATRPNTQGSIRETAKLFAGRVRIISILSNNMDRTVRAYLGREAVIDRCSDLGTLRRLVEAGGHSAAVLDPATASADFTRRAMTILASSGALVVGMARV